MWWDCKYFTCVLFLNILLLVFRITVYCSHTYTHFNYLLFHHITFLLWHLTYLNNFIIEISLQKREDKFSFHSNISLFIHIHTFSKYVFDKSTQICKTKFECIWVCLYYISLLCHSVSLLSDMPDNFIFRISQSFMI